MFTALGFTESISFSEIDDEQTVAELEAAINSSATGRMTGDEPENNIFTAVTRVIVEGFQNFFDPIKKYMFLPALIMQRFGMPRAISNIVSVLFTLVQAIGLIQLITGRSFKSAE